MDDLDQTLSDLILDAAPDGILVVDGEGVIQRLNPSLANLFGYTREELIGASVELLVPAGVRAGHEQLRADYIAAADLRPMGMGRELTGQRRDGSEFPVEISLSPAQTAAGAVVIAVVRDVTEHRRGQAERSRREALSQVRDFRDQVRMDLHDDILQDLIGLALHLEHSSGTALADPSAAPARMTWAADELRGVSRRLRRYIRDMQAPLPADGLPASFVGLRHELEADGLEVKLVLPTRLPVLEERVAVGLFHVAQEASTNIRRHAEAQSVLLSLRAPPARLRLEVCDDGIGFEAPVDSHPDHFGLRNMYDRTTALGGELLIDSRPGAGTRIVADVPLVQAR